MGRNSFVSRVLEWGRLYPISWSNHWIEITIGNPMVRIQLCQNSNHFPPFQHAHHAIGEQGRTDPLIHECIGWDFSPQPCLGFAYMFIFRCCDSISNWGKHQSVKLAVSFGFPQWKGVPALALLYHASPHWKPSWGTFPALTAFSIWAFIKCLHLASVSCPMCCHGPCFSGPMSIIFPQKSVLCFIF